MILCDRPCHLSCLAGQLGINTDTWRSNTPVLVEGPNGVSSISAGGSHTCAALADGTARCWGYNEYGKQMRLCDAVTVRQMALFIAALLSCKCCENMWLDDSLSGWQRVLHWLSQHVVS